LPRWGRRRCWDALRRPPDLPSPFFSGGAVVLVAVVVLDLVCSPAVSALCAPPAPPAPPRPRRRERFRRLGLEERCCPDSPCWEVLSCGPADCAPVCGFWAVD